jgi:ComF family protein
VLGLRREILDLLLPPCCAACGASAEEAALLCARCRGALPRIDVLACVGCQQLHVLPGAQRCARCIRTRGPLDACVAACWFEGAVAGWIRAFKYPTGLRAGFDGTARARLRALALETAAWAPGEPPEAVVPVPLHPRRLRARGFNPALEVARGIARAHALPILPTLLVRRRDTPSQTGLTRTARRRNVRQAFRASGPAPERLWLVDDVVTTGATLAAAARALRRGGARDVVGLCAARTPARVAP